MKAIKSRAPTVLVALMVCVSAAAGALFGYRLGHGVEGYVFAAVALIAEAFKCQLPLKIASAWRRGQYVRWALGILGVLVLLAYSLAAEIGLSYSSRTVETVTVQLSQGVLEGVRADIQRENKRLSELGAPRPPAVIANLIEAAKQDRLWVRSRECTEATVDESRRYCASLATLEAERAGASEAAAIRARLEALGGKLAASAAAPAVSPAEEQAKALGGMLGVNPSLVSLAICIALALVVELIATFGLYLLHDPPEATATAGRPRPQARAAPESKDVAVFAAEKLRKAKGQDIAAGELYAAYLEWAAGAGRPKISNTAFGMAMTWPKQRIGGRVRYLDVTILGKTPLRVVA